MTRILIGLTYYLPNISGVSIYARILAEELVKKGISVEVLCSRHKMDSNINEILKGVKVERVDGFSIGKGFLMWKYPFISFFAVRRCEIVNCHLPSIESFWLSVWSKLFHKKIIVTHHCEFGFSGNWSNKIVAGISFPIHFLTYLLADKIVAYTEDYANKSMFLRIFKKKLVFILPPIKLENSKRKFDFGNKKVVAYVGRIAWEKGIGNLIEAMDGIRAKLILVGPYKDVVGDNTVMKIRDKISDKVQLYGPLDHKYLKSFYTKIDCLVLPSTDNLETFGIVQAEAMKCGIPVVASNLPGVRVPVQMTGMGEICALNQVNDLRNKINLVLKNGKEFYQKHAKSLEMFDYRKTIEAYQSLF